MESEPLDEPGIDEAIFPRLGNFGFAGVSGIEEVISGPSEKHKLHRQSPNYFIGAKKYFH